jgi:hypothetical protein
VKAFLEEENDVFLHILGFFVSTVRLAISDEASIMANYFRPQYALD